MLISMSKLLEQAIERVRQLPEGEQDMAAAELIGYLADFPTSQERAAISEGRRVYKRGDFVSLDKWRRCAFGTRLRGRLASGGFHGSGFARGLAALIRTTRH
jgi:hypothetical protein